MDPFWKDAVDSLIREPDLEKRAEILERLPPKTRASVQAVFNERVRASLDKLEASGPGKTI
jgi:hypothetical protein